jgi:hypothetical protein
MFPLYKARLFEVRFAKECARKCWSGVADDFPRIDVKTDAEMQSIAAYFGQISNRCRRIYSAFI